ERVDAVRARAPRDRTRERETRRSSPPRLPFPLPQLSLVQRVKAMIALPALVTARRCDAFARRRVRVALRHGHGILTAGAEHQCRADESERILPLTSETLGRRRLDRRTTPPPFFLVLDVGDAEPRRSRTDTTPRANDWRPEFTVGGRRTPGIELRRSGPGGDS